MKILDVFGKGKKAKNPKTTNRMIFTYISINSPLKKLS